MVFLAKNVASKLQIPNPSHIIQPPYPYTYSALIKPNIPPTLCNTNEVNEQHTTHLTYAKALGRNTPTPKPQAIIENRGTTIEETLEEIKTSDLDLFIRIIEFI